jgi:ABC-type uncharacterized transport system substrate-binding protein
MFRPASLAILGLFAAAFPCAAQVLVVRADGGETSTAITSGFVQGAITADVAGLDYDQLTWSSDDAAQAALIAKVQGKHAALVFTNSGPAAQKLLAAMPNLKVVVAGVGDLGKFGLQGNPRVSAVLPWINPDSLFSFMQKRLNVKKLLVPVMGDRTNPLPASFTGGGKAVTLVAVNVPSLSSLDALAAALDGADGVLLVGGAITVDAPTVKELASLTSSRKKSLIGLDTRAVSLGAPIGLFADPGEEGSRAAELVNGMISGLPKTVYLENVSVAIRATAIESLNYNLKGLTIARRYE